MVKFKTLVFLMLLGLSSRLLAEEELVFDVQLSTISEDNVGRGFLTQDVHSDQIVQTLIGVTHEIEINKRTAVFLNANYLNQNYSEYTKLSSSQFSVRADYVVQPSIRYVSPIYTLSVGVTEADYQSQLRDSSIVKVSGRLFKRFTTKIKVAAEYAYTVREADTNVFDHQLQSVLMLLDYSLTDKVSLFASYRFQTGDSVSTMITTDPVLLVQTLGYDIINKADQEGALLPDDAFGGAAEDQYAYRVDADTQITELGTSVIFNEHHGLDASLILITSQIDNGLEYENFIVQMGYLARF